MQAELKAAVLGAEINLSKIAKHFGNERKFKWEDSLVLRDKTLQGIVHEPENKMVYIFHFGSMVFVNMQHHEMTDVVNYIKRIDLDLNITNLFKYVDDYKLDINPDEPMSINNDYMVIEHESDYHLEIIAVILAKSVALEKIEIEIDLLLDDVEDVVDYLNQGKLAVSDEQLAKMSGNILGFKFNTISYIMLLDKPAITWVNEEASALFSELSALFELQDRYEKIRHKTEILMDITEVFSGLAHAKRGTRLEWAVIILIVIEICLSVFDIFWKNR